MGNLNWMNINFWKLCTCNWEYAFWEYWFTRNVSSKFNCWKNIWQFSKRIVIRLQQIHIYIELPNYSWIDFGFKFKKKNVLYLISMLFWAKFTHIPYTVYPFKYRFPTLISNSETRICVKFSCYFYNGLHIMYIILL